MTRFIETVTGPSSAWSRRVLTLKLAHSATGAGRPTDDLIQEAPGYAERATAELRDLVHGILPASLIRGGLRSGIESLIADLPMSVELDFAAPRLPASTEITAYFIVAEALTNVVKHACATRATVGVGLHTGRVTIEVSDNGTRESGTRPRERADGADRSHRNGRGGARHH